MARAATDRLSGAVTLPPAVVSANAPDLAHLDRDPGRPASLSKCRPGRSFGMRRPRDGRLCISGRIIVGRGHSPSVSRESGE